MKDLYCFKYIGFLRFHIIYFAVDVFLYRVKILSTFYISIGHDEHR